MEQGPFFEADGQSASEEIPGFLWNPKVYHRIHRVPILSQIHSVDTLSPYIPIIHFNIIFPIFA
jgi:hypothetical protein